MGGGKRACVTASDKSTETSKQFILSTHRFVNAMVFLGLNLNAKNLGGDIYFNFFVLSVAGLPAGFVCFFLFKR